MFYAKSVKIMLSVMFQTKANYDHNLFYQANHFQTKVHSFLSDVVQTTANISVFHGNEVEEPANIFLYPLMEHNADQAQAKRSQVSGLHIVSVSGSHFMSLLEKKNCLEV